MKVAIIGPGSVGRSLGGVLAAAGHAVVYGARDRAKAAGELGPIAEVTSVADAVDKSEVVVLSVTWPGVKDALEACGDFAGKVLIDVTNPLDYGPQGLSLAIGFNGSGGECVAELAPSARVVKAFNTIAAPNMMRAGDFNPPLVTFLAGEDEPAKVTVAELARELGFVAIDTGPLVNARLLEPVAMLSAELAYVRGRGFDFGLALSSPPG